MILSDIRMPEMTGLEFLQVLRKTDCVAPVILISGHYDLPCAMDAISRGATDYLLKPALPEDILAAVAKNLVPQGPEGSLGMARRSQVTAATSFFDGSPATWLGLARRMQLMENQVDSMAKKRFETLEHSRRVAAYAVLTGRRTGGVNLEELEMGAMLHDIGKVGVPENVLNKAGALNADERRIMQLHPEIGRDLVQPFSGMSGVAEMIYSHHEHFSGSGYPRGLREGSIVLSARIFSVVDAFDAMTSARPYRPAQSVAFARAEIRRMSSSQFDPDVALEFLSIPETELDSIIRLHADSCSG